MHLTLQKSLDFIIKNGIINLTEGGNLCLLGIPIKRAEHLRHVAAKVSAFACPPFQETARWLGLLHDLGKYNPAFQKYIKQAGPKTPHSVWGALYMAFCKKTAESLCILGHHGGLGNAPSWEPDKEASAPNKALLNQMETSFRHELASSIKELTALPSPLEGLSPTQKEALFSCLIDADRLDIEAFCSPQKSSARPSAELDAALCLSLLEKNFKIFAQMPAPSTPCAPMPAKTPLKKRSCLWAFFH